MSELQEKPSLPNPFDTHLGGSGSNEPQILDGLVRELSTNNSNDSNDPNFPSFYPIVYHNINLEIPQKRSFIVRLNFTFARSICLCLFFSVIASFFSFQMKGCCSIEGFHAGKEIFLSIVTLFFGSALIFYVQYFPFYWAIRDERTNKSAVPVQICTMILIAILLLGIPGTGTVGFIYTYIAFHSDHIIPKFFSLVISIWQLLNMIGEIVIYILMRPIFRETNLLADRSQIIV